MLTRESTKQLKGFAVLLMLAHQYRMVLILVEIFF